MLKGSQGYGFLSLVWAAPFANHHPFTALSILTQGGTVIHATNEQFIGY